MENEKENGKKHKNTKWIVLGIIGIIILGMFFLSGEESKISKTFVDAELNSNVMASASFNLNDNRDIGYEYLNSSGQVVSEINGEVIHIWNEQDDYFIDKFSGIQLTNHFQDYWSNNLWCVYVNWGQWKKACANEFEWTWELSSDDETYVNLTGYTTLGPQGAYNADIILEYYLGQDAREIRISPTILNTKKDFEGYIIWRIQDIQINMTEENDIIQFDDYEFMMNETINNSFNNLTKKEFYIRDDDEFLFLKWIEEDYSLRLFDESGQYNSPVEVWLGPFNIPKDTSYNTTFYWIDAIAFDAISDGTGSGTNTITVQHTTTGTATNGILVVTVQVTDASETDRVIFNVTYGGTGLTHLDIADSDDNIEERTEIWIMDDPPEQTANIVVTASGSCTDLSLGAISLTGVNASGIFSDTYYFDGSDTPANEPAGEVWADITNSDDGNTGTTATTDTAGSSSTNYIHIEGTNAPGSGGTINQVRARIHGGSNWGYWKTIPPPGGSWSWEKVQSLDVRIWRSGGGANPTTAGIYDDSTSLSFVSTVDSGSVSRVEISVGVNVLTNASVGDSSIPTLSITTAEDNSIIVDSLATAETDGTKIGVQHTSIHKTDVGGDTHASQYLNTSTKGGTAGVYVMNYSDTDADKSWVMSAVAISPFVEAGGDTEDPKVYLLAPTNGTSGAVDTYSFNMSFTDDNNVTNATYYLWNSTFQNVNLTTKTLGDTTSESWNLSITFPYTDTFKWNAWACDGSNNCAWNATNFTVTYSTVTDSCTAPGAGDWVIDCGDYCNWTTNQNIPADIFIWGSGKLNLEAEFNMNVGQKAHLLDSATCQLIGKPGGAFV